MSDFEERLTRALTDGAEDAPRAAGLAGAARRRRRRRTRCLGIAGAVALVVAVAVPIALLRPSGDDRDGPGPVDESPPTSDDAWQVVEAGGTEVALPPGWSDSGRDGCDPTFTGDTENLRILCVGVGEVRLEDGPVNLDSLTGPGELRGGDGYVLVGDDVVIAVGLTRDVALRILGSAQPSRGAAAATAPSWTETALGCRVDVPIDTEVGVTCALLRGTATPEPARQREDGRWAATGASTTGQLVRVVAPTQAIADLVAASARAEDRAEIGWRRVTENGATFDVPADWTSPPDCTGPGPAPAYGPGDSDDGCREVGGVFVYFAGTFDPAYGPGVQRCVGRGWCGYRIVGDVAVFVGGVDRITAGRILDSVMTATR